MLVYLDICAGHGDKTSRNLPKQVKDIGLVGQVACGSSHTIAISQDGKTVWSFGGGDNGEFTAVLCHEKLTWISLVMTVHISFEVGQRQVSLLYVGKFTPLPLVPELSCVNPQC